MAVDAVIFDWGGTLTPWRTIDFSGGVGVRSLRSAAPDRHEEATAALVAAADAGLGPVAGRAQQLDARGDLPDRRLCRRRRAPRRLPRVLGAGDDDRRRRARAVRALRAEGIKVGVLSNTVWPRAWHEEIFVRDGIDQLIDGAVYTSDIAWTKPAPEAFHAAMEAVGASDPEQCVFVGDRLFDDIYGAQNVGMRAVHVPHSDIPTGQIGHTEGEPDAVIHRLAEIPDVIRSWR